MAEKTAKSRHGVKTAAVLLAVLAGALACVYLGCCAWVSFQDTFFPGYHIENVDVGGMTVEEAARALKTELTGRTFSLWVDEQTGEPDLILTAEQLGLLPDGADTDYAALAQAAYDDCRDGTFLSSAYDYFRSNSQGAGACYVLPASAESICLKTAQSLVNQLSYLPIHAEYTVEGDSLIIRIPKDGRTINSRLLAEALNAVRLETRAEDRRVVAKSIPLPADVITAQEIHDAIYQDMTYATYDKTTGGVLEGITGVDFDAEAAQQLMDASVPGTLATFRLTLNAPAITVETLEQVMFRDVLATYTTNVAGTAARKNNVKLSAKAINGYVLNYGELFSYNEAVGKRTAARGYQAAPAYVGGQTVDEIGGGICQTSSTLYMSCLLANLEITERRPHRYATAYMPYGMDATVSWGGPDYKFTNNTDYPIRIETKYEPGATSKEDGKLTVTLYGTKTDDITVKMTYTYLERIDWTTEYEEDPTMAPGTEKVKTSAYVGHKVQTYRELYDGQGSLISRTKEAYSYYKARNRVIVRGPALPEPPAQPETPAVNPTPGVTDPDVTEPPADNTGGNTSPGTGETPGAGTADKPADTTGGAQDTPGQGGTADAGGSQDAPGGAETPAEPSAPAEPDVPAQPSEPAVPDVVLPPA